MARLKVAILCPKIAKKWGFSPLEFVRGHVGPTKTPIGDKLFQHIPRRVAKFRENWPRDVENLVDGKK